MNLTGEVNRTFTINRIPATWVGITVELGFEADFSYCIIRRVANKPSGGLPGSAAWSSSDHFNVRNSPILNFNFKFRSTKIIAIAAKTNLPW